MKQDLGAVEHRQVDGPVELPGEPLQETTDDYVQVTVAGDREAEEPGSEMKSTRHRIDGDEALLSRAWQMRCTVVRAVRRLPPAAWRSCRRWIGQMPQDGGRSGQHLYTVAVLAVFLACCCHSPSVAATHNSRPLNQTQTYQHRVAAGDACHGRHPLAALCNAPLTRRPL